MAMQRISTLVSVITLLAVGANAPRAYGQDATSLTRPITVGISGGVAVPSGELSTGRHNGFSGTNTGYDITGSLEFALPVSSFGVRLDASYDRFGTRNIAFPAIAPACTAVCTTSAGPPVGYNADVRVLSYMANLVYKLPWRSALISPYVLGGGGVYNVVQEPAFGDNYTQTNAGYDLGAGATLPLGAFRTFIEARYQRVNQHSGNVAFTPISLGVEF
jgi:outer membrane protein with beta-barrel domain